MNAQINYYKNKLSYEMDPAELFENLQNGRNIIIIDTRKSSSFTKEHIPTSINVPHREMNEDSTKHLSKEYLYVTYCDGIGCNASTKGALNMSKLGFNVKELIGGLEWWKFDGYSTTRNTIDSNTNDDKCSC